MKNIFLLCAIMCASQLYGMEPEQSHMEKLSPEVKTMIIGVLHNTYNPKFNSEEDLNNIVNAIKTMSEVNLEFNAIVKYIYNNQKKFTKIIYTLAAKFNYTPSNIATKFKTPLAKKYVNLTDKLEDAATNFNSEEVKNLIEQGADINAREMLQLVIIHYGRRNFDNIYNMIKLLLKHGANPSTKHPFSGATALDRVEEFSKYYTIAEKEQLITLLKEASAVAK